MDIELLKILAGSITGSGGAIVVAVLWVRATLKQYDDLSRVVEKKDQELLSITRESIACIQAMIGKSDMEEKFRLRLEDLLKRVEKILDAK